VSELWANLLSSGGIYALKTLKVYFSPTMMLAFRGDIAEWSFDMERGFLVIVEKACGVRKIIISLHSISYAVEEDSGW